MHTLMNVFMIITINEECVHLLFLFVLPALAGKIGPNNGETWTEPEADGVDYLVGSEIDFRSAKE